MQVELSYMPEIRKRISTACQIDKLQRELSKVSYSCIEIVTLRAGPLVVLDTSLRLLQLPTFCPFQPNRENSWFKKAAEDLDMILDDDLLRDQPDDMSRKQQKIANMKVGYTPLPNVGGVPGNSPLTPFPYDPRRGLNNC
jgi:hypothetical protein